MNLEKMKPTYKAITKDVMEVLMHAGCIIDETRPVDNGTQIRLADGCTVTCYDTGRFNVQGKNQEGPRAALQDAFPETCMTTRERRLFRQRLLEYSDSTEAKG